MGTLEEDILAILGECEEFVLGEEQIPQILQFYGQERVYQKVEEMVERGTLVMKPQRMIGLPPTSREGYPRKIISVTGVPL